MVGLAKRLEGKPFHLIAAFNQDGTKEWVEGYLRGKGLAPSAPNFTVTKGGRHPDVKGNGYVPYYMVFDHTGKLVQEHMCGSYHGGDGLKMIEWVDKLLKGAPDIYLGKGPWGDYDEFAQQVMRKKNLDAAVLVLEKQTDGDALRILDGVRRYRDQKLAYAQSLLASDPAAVVGVLKSIAGELKGTKLGAEPAEQLAKLEQSADLKDAIKIAKKFAAARKRLERCKCCKPCKRTEGLRTIRLGCATCRADNKVALKRAKKKLAKLVEGKDQLPIAKTIQSYLNSLG